jgi:hypothetical protein
MKHAHNEGWAFSIAPELSPQVNRVLELTSLKNILTASHLE